MEGERQGKFPSSSSYLLSRIIMDGVFMLICINGNNALSGWGPSPGCPEKEREREIKWGENNDEQALKSGWLSLPPTSHLSFSDALKNALLSLPRHQHSVRLIHVHSFSNQRSHSRKEMDFFKFSVKTKNIMQIFCVSLVQMNEQKHNVRMSRSPFVHKSLMLLHNI